MKKNKKKQNLLIIVLVLVVGVMSVFYAWTATTTLGVTGTVKVNDPKGSWEIAYVTTESDGTYTAQAEVCQDASCTAANIGTIAAVTEEKPTSISFTLNSGEEITATDNRTIYVMTQVKNYGTYNADLGTPTITASKDGTSYDSAFSITATLLKSGTSSTVLPSGTSATLLYTITYDAGSAPSDDFNGNKSWGIGTIDGITLTIGLPFTHTESAS